MASVRVDDGGRISSWLREHWPLPIAFGLAILYWEYADKRIKVGRQARVAIVHNVNPATRLSDLSGKAIYFMTPPNYIITDVLDEEGKPLDASRKMTFVFEGPKEVVGNADNDAKLLVEIPEPSEPQVSFSHAFERGDVRTAQHARSQYVISMDPPQITVQLEKSDRKHFQLSASMIEMRLPEPVDQWRSRVFEDTLSFVPKSVIMTGPKRVLDQIGESDKLFVMDCGEQLESLATRYTGLSDEQRPSISVLLELKRSDLRLLQGEVIASIEFAPKPVSSGQLTIDILPIWTNSTLDPAQVQVDPKSIKIRITSFNRALSQELGLSDRVEESEEAKAWAARWLICLVDLGEIDLPQEADAVRAVQPRFVCRTNRYKHEVDFKVTSDDAIIVRRKN